MPLCVACQSTQKYLSAAHQAVLAQAVHCIASTLPASLMLSTVRSASNTTVFAMCIHSNQRAALYYITLLTFAQCCTTTHSIRLATAPTGSATYVLVLKKSIMLLSCLNVQLL